MSMSICRWRTRICTATMSTISTAMTLNGMGPNRMRIRTSMRRYGIVTRIIRTSITATSINARLDDLPRQRAAVALPEFAVGLAHAVGGLLHVFDGGGARVFR